MPPLCRHRQNKSLDSATVCAHAARRGVVKGSSPAGCAADFSSVVDGVAGIPRTEDAMSTGPLTDKHLLIGLMTVAGKPTAVIADSLGISAPTVRTIQSSPLFQAHLDTLRKELRDSTVGTIRERLLAEAGKSLDVVVELRDHAETEAVRLNASTALLDRIPETSKVQRESHDNTLKIVFGSEDITRMLGAMHEDGPRTIDVTPTKSAQVASVTLDDLAAELAAQED